MNTINYMKVIPYSEERVPNPYPKGPLPWQIYHKVRNAVVRTCRRHGPTGPMGECRISRWRAAPNIFKWQRGDPDPVYYIIDDQYNDERYLYAELLGQDPFNLTWLADIGKTLEEFPGWGIGVNNIPGHYIIIFYEKLLVNGPRLSTCKKASEVVDTVKELLRQHEPG